MNRFQALSDNTSKNVFKRREKSRNSSSSSPCPSPSPSPSPSNSGSPSNSNSKSNSKSKYVPPNRRNRNNMRGNSNPNSQRRNRWKPAKSWKPAKKEFNVNEQNFPELGGVPSNNNNNIQNIPTDEEKRQQVQYMLATMKKLKTRKPKPEVEAGWVKLKRVNGKTVQIHGKTTKKEETPRQKQQRINNIIVKNMQQMRVNMMNAIERDGFWDNRMDELEEILFPSDSDDDDDYGNHYSDDDMEDPSQYNGSNFGKWWTS